MPGNNSTPNIDWGNFKNYFSVEEFKIQKFQSETSIGDADYLTFIVEAKGRFNTLFPSVKFYDLQRIESGSGRINFDPLYYDWVAGQRSSAYIELPPNISKVEFSGW